MHWMVQSLYTSQNQVQLQTVSQGIGEVGYYMKVPDR